MAAMQKCLELGGLYYGQAYGLCRLLAHRFTWIQQSFVKWKKGKHTLKFPLLPLDTKELHFTAVHIRICMVAALIPLQALFYTYISEYQTTHPISEVWLIISGSQKTHSLFLGNWKISYSLWMFLFFLHMLDMHGINFRCIQGQFQNQPPIGRLKKYKIENETLLYGTVTYITALLLHIVAVHI